MFKAKSDSFAALDAIMTRKEGEDSIIAAFQLTVAANHHPVQQSMIIDFCKTCNEISKEAKPQLCFLQPENRRRCIDQQPKESTRKHIRTRYYGDVISTDGLEGKLTSNGRKYWHQTVQSLAQIGLVSVFRRRHQKAFYYNSQYYL